MMRCRPSLLWALAGLPALGLTFYGLLFAWQGEPGRRVRDHLERRHDRAEDARRLGRHRAADGLLGDLATGRIGRGHPLAAVLAARAPDRRYEYPPFTECYYDLGGGAWVQVIARDGEVVEAEWTWQAVEPPYHRRQFLRDVFLAMTPAETREHNLIVGNWFADRRAAHMAAGGTLGYTALHEPLP